MAVSWKHGIQHRARRQAFVVKSPYKRPATSRRPLRSWPPASRTARTTWCSWEPPVRARPRRLHGSSNGCSGRRSSSSRTRHSPRSYAPNSANSCPTTRSATSSATTTTTSPRRIYRRPTRTSRRTPTSTTMWSGCAIRPPRTCSRGVTAWSSPPFRASTARYAGGVRRPHAVPPGRPAD